MLSFVMQLVHPGATFADVDAAAYRLKVQVGGETYAEIINFVTIAGSIASCIALQASAARLMYVMGRDGALPKAVFATCRKPTPVLNLLLTPQCHPITHLPHHLIHNFPFLLPLTLPHLPPPPPPSLAGVASIRYLIGNSVHALAAVPTAERDLLLHPGSVGPAVEELLRVCTPVSFVGRVAGEDFEYTASDGTVVPLRKGRPLLLYVASANRDPDVFDRPDELVLDRPLPNRHLTFGIGRHPLLRRPARASDDPDRAECPVPQVAGPARAAQETNWNNNLGFHGFTSLWVTDGH
ncbi:hypothetical protein SANTM175S_02198 [Streptomyces antimycoticus]